MDPEAPIGSFSVDPRFCGPPTSGNGGYVCGRVAEYLDGPCAVRLHIPPPLSRPLHVHPTEEGVELLDAQTVVATAKPADLDITPPAALDFDTASEASRSFRGFDRHFYPGCFVCGPERHAGDGLRVFVGAVGDSDLYAAPWRPDPSLASPEQPGRVRPEFLWAALDCPGGFTFAEPESGTILLGELTVRPIAPIAVGERCVLAAWEIEHTGRKHITGSALYGENGDVRGVARGVWIEVREPTDGPSTA